MLQPPQLKRVLQYPVTGGIALGAIAMTGLWWTGTDVTEWATMDLRVWQRWELWRGLTSALLHVSIFHLAFNLYWWWVFGTFLERVFGHLKLAGIVVVLALSSSFAEFMFLYGGVGLSGVGYGLWGMLWVLAPRDARFADTVDANTNKLFVGWFFLCIALTLTDVMPVGNIAHGVGAITGALLGFVINTSGRRKIWSVAGLVAVLVVGLAGATVAWPWVNFSKYKPEALAYAGWEALDHNDNASALRWLEMAVRSETPDARTWFHLGIVYGRLERRADALAAFEQASQRPGATEEMRRYVRELKEYEARIKK